MADRKHTDLIVVHCSATFPFLDIGAEEIRVLHASPKGQMVPWNGGQMPAFGWADIGYHYVIRRDGAVDEGRPEDAIGAHVRGYNEISIGICLVGGADGKFDYTRRQLEALAHLIQSILIVKRYSRALVVGHRDYTRNKTCPNFDVKQWWYNGAWKG